MVRYSKGINGAFSGKAGRIISNSRHEVGYLKELTKKKK